MNFSHDSRSQVKPGLAQPPPPPKAARRTQQPAHTHTPQPPQLPGCHTRATLLQCRRKQLPQLPVRSTYVWCGSSGSRVPVLRPTSSHSMSAGLDTSGRVAPGGRLTAVVSVPYTSRPHVSSPPERLSTSTAQCCSRLRCCSCPSRGWHCTELLLAFALDMLWSTRRQLLGINSVCS